MGLKKFIKKAVKQLKVNIKHAGKTAARVMAISATLAAINTGIVFSEFAIGAEIG